MRVVYAGGVEERKTGTAEKVAGMPTATTTRSKLEEVGRLPSIEMEPKTLTLRQINYAREVALYVVGTTTEEEAIRIFTAGLKPVQTTVRKSSSVDSSDDDVDLDGCFLDGGSGQGGRRGRQTAVDMREVITAPF